MLACNGGTWRPWLRTLQHCKHGLAPLEPLAPERPLNPSWSPKRITIWAERPGRLRQMFQAQSLGSPRRRDVVARPACIPRRNTSRLAPPWQVCRKAATTCYQSTCRASISRRDAKTKLFFLAGRLDKTFPGVVSSWDMTKVKSFLLRDSASSNTRAKRGHRSIFFSMSSGKLLATISTLQFLSSRRRT